MTTTAQQIADHLATLAGNQVPRTMPADAFDKHIKPKMVEAMLGGGLMEAVKELERIIEPNISTMTSDYAKMLASYALVHLKGGKA